MTWPSEQFPFINPSLVQAFCSGVTVNISSGVVAFALVISAQQWVAFWTGLTLWVFSLFVLRLMAKADPLMRFVYLRHIRYAAYYPARSTPFRENTRNYK